MSNNLNLTDLNCSSNQLTELDVSNNLELAILYCSNNKITKLVINENSIFTNVFCYINQLKFSTLPIIANMNVGTYQYAEQDVIYGGVKEYTDTVDLSSEYEINGYITNYEWVEVIDEEEKEIVQPTNDGGIFSFTEEHKDKKLRCKMTNEQFPSSMVGGMYVSPFIIEYETDIVDGISENSITTHFTISPNPVSGEDATASFGLLESGEITIEVCDLLGECFYNITNFYDTGDHSVTLDIKGIPSGSYICRILTKGKQIATESFVVGK